MKSKMITTKIKKWGNSMGILLSKKDIVELNIRENDDVQLILSKKTNVLMDMAGSMKFSKPTRQLLDESRKNSSKWGLN